MEKGDVIGTTETWLRKHRLMYVAATRHPFILSVRDGTVDLNSFKRWLGQDYLFVRAFVAFVSSVLLKSCKESSSSSSSSTTANDDDMEVLLGGLAALNDEIAWFKTEASRWGVQLSAIVPQQPNRDYCRFLEGLMEPEVGYTGAMVALWTIEVVYQQSFAHCLEEGSMCQSELMDTCKRWGNEEFGKYCLTLRKIVDRRLMNATDTDLKNAEVVFLRVLDYEVEFWNMSRG